MTSGYTIAGVLPDSPLEEFDPGTNVAIVGPSMSQKRELALGLMATGYNTGDGILCITTDSPNNVFTSLERYTEEFDENHVGIINCSGSKAQRQIEELTESVSSPDDLTGISIATAKLYNQFQKRGLTEIRYGLISVSTLIQYLNSKTMFKFLHVFTNRVNQTNGLGIYTLDNDIHDPQVVNTIQAQFDGIIELREDETGAREYRVRGFNTKTAAWSPLD
jgi:KaiC/GvpD/RAD55 family RecA-like ATPase